MIVSYNDCMFSSCFSESRLAVPLTADAYTTGKSNCSSFASNSINKSKTSSTTPSGLADGLSIYLLLQRVLNLVLMLFSTKRV